KDYAELIKSRTVTEAVIAKLGLDMNHEDLIGKMTVETTTDTRIVTIKIVDEDPYMARDIANAIRDTAAEHIQNVMNSEAVNVVDEANIPDKKFSPSTMKNGMIAGLLGCFLAVAIILIGHISNDTIKTSEDVERYLGLSTLGTIPLNKDDVKSKKKKIKNYKRR
ncbi:MAG: protein-tyrosine kinase, partial [Oliverpabstia sp.]|nr:protein-tyrosine kinase [Oliverpabstia sp.]